MFFGISYINSLHVPTVKKTINQLESFAEHAISMVEVEGESTYNYIGNRTWNIGELPEFSIEKVIKNVLMFQILAILYLYALT